MKNGTVVVLCTWSIHAADSLEGPWRTVLSRLLISPSTRMGVGGDWEDPFLFQDPYGNWHVLSHTYTHQPAGPSEQNSISGHLYARNLEGPWLVSPDEPYDNLVHYADNTTQVGARLPARVQTAADHRRCAPHTQTFSTMERPKLMFDDSGNPTHITNGVSPVYPCDSCKGFGDAPKDGGCCWCKVTPGEDWTYTLMQPIGTSILG